MNKIIEKEFFILKPDELNKNYRKYSFELVQKWINDMDEYGYEVEFGIDFKSKDIQYEFIKTDLVCGLITKLYLDKENILKGTVKFFTEGYKSDEIYSKKINLDECVLIPKGKAEVREGVVQNNYKLFGFNIVKKYQSSFVI